MKAGTGDHGHQQCAVGTTVGALNERNRMLSRLARSDPSTIQKLTVDQQWRMKSPRSYKRGPCVALVDLDELESRQRYLGMPHRLGAGAGQPAACRASCMKRPDSHTGGDKFTIISQGYRREDPTRSRGEWSGSCRTFTLKRSVNKRARAAWGDNDELRAITCWTRAAFQADVIPADAKARGRNRYLSADIRSGKAAHESRIWAGQRIKQALKTGPCLQYQPSHRFGQS